MNDWLKKFFGQLKTLWSKWSTVQKAIFVAIAAGALIGLFMMVGMSAAPTMEQLIGVPITDEARLNKIVTTLDREGAEYQITADNRIMIENEAEARRLRSILIREDLIPQETDPWAIFDVERWTLTDFERDVNLRRAITGALEQHILALDDIDAVSVSLVIPERTLFAEDQNPVTASVIITPRPGSDILENKNKIQGIEKIIKFAVEGLSEENITITDHRGIVLNDFTGMEDVDRLELAQREMKTVRNLEAQYKHSIITALRQIFGEDRVEIINLDISLDFSKKKVETEEHYPITMTPDNPETPYNETEVVPSITISKATDTEKFEGTGFNPEGPPGQEGQTPPAYKDLDNLVGKYNRDSMTQNEVVNTRNIVEEKSPWKVERITTGVAIDGIWKKKYDENGNPVLTDDGSIEREYTPVSEEALQKAATLVEHAIGYDPTRGDSVTVEHLQFDRTKQFLEEDAVYRRRAQIRQILIYSLIGVGIIIVAFVIFRFISKELERRRRQREEELARQHQAMREAALKSAEEEGVEVEMSVEDRARMELQENAINMAREHPEDVAQLIRTWLAEE
ncbi:MAG: flagellar M-ring protein FliF [Spirochaetales bacterium]|nr:flagellar M-ring protein FliF [Spirochaetales bacterium]MCF7937617.1 flagellar M-ring protein FliF [Spirochaetales bacterium]